MSDQEKMLLEEVPLISETLMKKMLVNTSGAKNLMMSLKNVKSIKDKNPNEKMARDQREAQHLLLMENNDIMDSKRSGILTDAMKGKSMIKSDPYSKIKKKTIEAPNEGSEKNIPK